MSVFHSTTRVEFRPVLDFPGYRVGDDGSVWSCRTQGFGVGRIGPWKQLKRVSADGYPQVALRRDGKTYYRLVHRLVLEAFVGPCPPGMEACHWDDVRSNGALSNLRWDTRRENKADELRNGHRAVGERSHSRLTDELVRSIREGYASGIKQRTLAEEHGLDQSSVSRIVNRKRWVHLG